MKPVQSFLILCLAFLVGTEVYAQKVIQCLDAFSLRPLSEVSIKAVTPKHIYLGKTDKSGYFNNPNANYFRHPFLFSKQGYETHSQILLTSVQTSQDTVKVFLSNILENPKIIHIKPNYRLTEIQENEGRNALPDRPTNNQEKTNYNPQEPTNYTPLPNSITNRGVITSSPVQTNSVQGYPTKNNYERKQITYPNSEANNYAPKRENGWINTFTENASTFSIDVDRASYSNIRRFLNSWQLPPKEAVRVEEMINYFPYDYAQPDKNQAFRIHTEYGDCPWNSKSKLMLIGIKGRDIPREEHKPFNLVFLVDVSGSMSTVEKLPLVKKSLKLLVTEMRENDKISLVVYAGAAGLVLPPTKGSEKEKINQAIDNLNAGGSTAGGAGLHLAYQTAKEGFLTDGINRVILCTDGDFNVGISSENALVSLIEEKRKDGVFLSVLGFGKGNYQEAKMQALAQKGNGNHAYIDTYEEAKKILIEEFGGTLITIAKDVKLQLAFNPKLVKSYRLIGYENRMLNKEDFENDKIDAGELGAGHTVTAIYEIIPQNDDYTASMDNKNIEVPLAKDEIMMVSLRYKEPNGDKSRLIKNSVYNTRKGLHSQSDALQWASCVAEFGLLLSDSEYKAKADYTSLIRNTKKYLGHDLYGYRKEFLKMVETAEKLTNR